MEIEQEERIIKTTTQNVFEILRKNGFEIREKKNTFQRTEQLLYLIPSLKDAINKNNTKIKELQEYGINKGGGAIHIVPRTTPVKQEETEIIESKINVLNQRNFILNKELKSINEIINTMSSEKFFKIIELKYFKGKTSEEIAEYFECDVSTISRNKNKMINKLRVLFFPNDCMSELGI